MKPAKRWYVVVLNPYTGDIAYYIAEYSNRGHAMARYKNLCRKAHAATSEMVYAIRRG